MTDMEKLLQEVDERVGATPTKTLGYKTKAILKSLAAGIMLFLAEDAIAQEVKVQDPQLAPKEVVYQAPADMLDSTISFMDVAGGTHIEPNPELGEDEGEVIEEQELGEEGEIAEEQDGGDKESTGDQGKEMKAPIEIHGSVRGGSDVTPLFGSVLSDRPALILTLDVSNPQTGLGLSVIRADDFSKSMDNPASQVTLVDLYWQKKFGKVGFVAVGEYASIDKLPGSESITPLVGVTYDAGKGWIFDAWVGHTFQKGEDADMARLGITKRLDEAFSVAAQVFFNSELAKKTYIRVQADVKFEKGFGAQLSFIFKDGKITPTAGIIYKF